MADPKGKAKKTPASGASAGRKTADSKVSTESPRGGTPRPKVMVRRAGGPVTPPKRVTAPKPAAKPVVKAAPKPAAKAAPKPAAKTTAAVKTPLPKAAAVVKAVPQPKAPPKQRRAVVAAPPMATPKPRAVAKTEPAAVPLPAAPDVVEAAAAVAEVLPVQRPRGKKAAPTTVAPVKPEAKRPPAVRPVTPPKPAKERVAAAVAVDPAIAGAPTPRQRTIELLRESRKPKAPVPAKGLLYDIRVLTGLFVLAVGIVAIGLWELLAAPSPNLPNPAGGAILPGNGFNLPGGALLPVLAIVVGGVMVVRGVRRHRALKARGLPTGKGWRWIYDTRTVATVIAVVLATYGFQQLAPPGTSPDIREIPGEVSNAIQAAAAQPESGFPRVKISAVSIDLLLVKGDGKTPPVKYEAFTYPGADHLLTGDENGGSNTYVYAHARNGMFWRLHDLHIGNIIDVDYGGNKILHYRVSEIHPSVNWKDLQWLQPTTDDRLTLQTCNGWKDEDPRFIVVARRVPDKTALG